MAKGIGFGKVILFNEHFVVYGIPAIASAIGMKTVAEVKAFDGEGIDLNDRRKETPGYKKEKLEQQKDSLKRMLNAMGIDSSKKKINITLSGDLIASSGIGASAASCVAIARALSNCFSLNLSDDRINDIAYEGEKGYHGSPSGIDNTVATYGGLVWFKKGEKMERLKLKKQVEIVMGNTGIVADTSKAVADVRSRKEKDPDKYKKLFSSAEELVYNARKEIGAFDLVSVGNLMDENHKLLQEIEVSCKELDFLVNLARENGALGAKLTGTGLGGNMLALTPGKKLQEKVAKAIEKEGFKALRTKIG
ncbi:MAG: mevalonate kinase [Candidatus Thermoplasmatota archaeon]